MRPKGAKQQTIFLTAINGVVRALGLAMRVWMSRLLGAEVMGVMELAQSVHMVAISPLTSGLPMAISRLTARAKAGQKQEALAAGLSLARIAAFCLVPLMWLFSPWIARAMGDVRVLPSLWFTAPCILILGYSAAYNGYCYGMERSELPALSELIEQLVRFGLTVALLHVLSRLTVPWLAAVPVFATMTAEMIGLCYVISKLKMPRQAKAPDASWKNAILRLAAPATCSRMLQTLLRSVTAMMIPARLHASGLSIQEATAQLGMLNGMVMPILMLPGIFTSALAMVMQPKIAKAEEQPSEFRRLLRLSAGSCIPFSVLCAVLIHAAAQALALFVFRQPDLTVIFRICAPQVVLMTLNQLVGSLLSALGQQRRSLYVSCTASAATLVLTWFWAGNASLRLTGVIQAHYASHLCSVFLGIWALLRWRKERYS